MPSTMALPLLRKNEEWGMSRLSPHFPSAGPWCNGQGLVNPIMDAGPADPASVPKPPNPILLYDKCATKIRNQARSDRWTISLIQNVSFGNIVAACGFTGPDAGLCVGIVGGVNLLNSGVVWVGTQVSIYDGETACLQNQ
jgi:hypothetical protein